LVSGVLNGIEYRVFCKHLVLFFVRKFCFFFSCNECNDDVQAGVFRVALKSAVFAEEIVRIANRTFSYQFDAISFHVSIVFVHRVVTLKITSNYLYFINSNY